MGLSRTIVIIATVLSTSALQLQQSTGTNTLAGIPARGINLSSLDKARKACEASLLALNSSPTSGQEFPQVIEPQSPFYRNRTETIDVGSTGRSSNCWQHASCVIVPQTIQQVAQVLKIVRDNDSKFSIRSGGHDFNVNHSNVGKSGVLIDMVDFNHVSLSSDKQTVTVGVGTRWNAVYNTLKGTGLSVNGGRSPNPGVGGQMLGGGIGWFSNVAGPSAASIVAAEVVLPNSTVVQADSVQNPELLWALKGGSANFGVVTSLTLQTLPYDKIWFEARTYTADKNEQLLNALYEYQLAASRDPKANIVYQLSTNTTVPQSFIGFFHVDPVERPSIFQPFYAIPANASRINSTIGTLAELASHYDNPVFPEAPPSRDYVVSLPHKIDNRTYFQSYNAFVSLAEEASAFGGQLNYGAQPVGPQFVNASLETPLGLSPISQDCTLGIRLETKFLKLTQTGVHVTMNWASAEEDAHAIEIIHKMGAAIQSAAVENDADLPFRFMNDAYDGQKVFEGYGAANLQRLQQIAAYDPEGMFQHLQNGGWLLSNVHQA
ncbi:MAG: hypothetical protein Q9162_006296 [Coniocarpon cinnabarinum]